MTDRERERVQNIFSHQIFDLLPPTVISHRLCCVLSRVHNKLHCDFCFSQVPGFDTSTIMTYVIDLCMFKIHICTFF